MPNIFALQGPGGCGKSTTLNSLFQAIKNKYTSSTIQTIHRGTRDFAVIMSGVNGLRVGIESQGDPNSRLQKTLINFSTANCDIIFCACRTGGMTVGWVNALSPAYTIHFISQNIVANNYLGANAATVSALMQQAGI